ncbi:MAG: WecB/TagA/CpsF family glycosyltransferase [Candidatus Nanopelagicales bacterium]|nr:WecB/TagA/CpsF family glycosyltransferase [Candidatus Nanopelagicales bacterium]MDZ4250871.1 WecB/TagA/CpsF family glycosyltransferase [Candidatus Nanopelagicales bacterium]
MATERADQAPDPVLSLVRDDLLDVVWDGPETGSDEISVKYPEILLSVPRHSVPTVPVFGIELSDEAPTDLVTRALADFEERRECRTVLAMHITALNSIEQPGVRAALAEADYLHADGVSVAIIAKLAGARAIAPMPTTDLAPKLLEAFAERWGRPPRVALIGGPPGSAEAGVEALVSSHCVCPVFTAHGFHDDWTSVLQELCRAEPDLVFVGLGMPLEAFWAQRWRDELPPALVISCGGWFRLLSGEQSRAPRWLLRIHLEFLWRWATDFRRTNERYSRGILTVARGCVAAVRERFRSRSWVRSLAGANRTD